MKSIIDLPPVLTKKLHTAALIGLLCLLAFLGAKAQPYQPTGGILYVNQQVDNPGGDGSSWENAIPELADALKWAKESESSWSAANPLKIYVAKGTYKPMYSPADNNFGNNGGRNNSFLLVNNVQLYGGFVGDEDELDGSADDLASRNFENNRTTLSGDLDGDGTLNGGNAYHVVVSVGTVGSALLDGFVISGGNTDGASTILTVNEQLVDWDRGGGGMFNNDSSPTLTNMTVSGNSAYYGGGMCNLSSSPVFKNGAVSGNRAADGGGVVNDDYSTGLT